MNGVELDVSGDSPTINLQSDEDKEYVDRPFRIYLLTDLPTEPNVPEPEWVSEIQEAYEPVEDIVFETAGMDLFDEDAFDFHEHRDTLNYCQTVMDRCDGVLLRYDGELSQSQLLQLANVSETTDSGFRKSGNIAIWNDGEGSTKDLQRWIPTTVMAKESAEKDGNETPLSYGTYHDAVGHLLMWSSPFSARFLRDEQQSPKEQIRDELSEITV